MKKNSINAAQSANTNPVIYNPNLPNDEFTQKAYFYFSEHFSDDEPVPTKDELLQMVDAQTMSFIDDVYNDLDDGEDAKSTVETLLVQRTSIEALFSEDEEGNAMLEEIDAALAEAYEVQPDLKEMDFVYCNTYMFLEAFNLIAQNA